MYVHVHESCNRRRCVHRRWRMHQCQCVHRCWRIHRRQRRVVHRRRRLHTYHTCHYLVSRLRGGLLTSFIAQTSTLHYTLHMTYMYYYYLVSTVHTVHTATHYALRTN